MRFLVAIVILFSGVANAQDFQAMQQMMQKTWGNNYQQVENQPRQQRPQTREIKCITRQKPGTGLFGNAPEYETVCK